MPRAGLTTLLVIETAEALADELGLENVSLTAIAQRTGVRVPSLYKHIDGLPALRHTLAVRAKDDLARELESAADGLTGATAVDAIAFAYRSWAHRYPGRYAATLRAPAADDPADVAASARAVHAVSAALTEFGLEGDELTDAIRTLRSALHGFVSLEAAHGFGLPLDVNRSFTRMVRSITASLPGGPS